MEKDGISYESEEYIIEKLARVKYKSKPPKFCLALEKKKKT